MKSIKYFGLTLMALLCAVGFTGCTDDELGAGDLALSIKVFTPTKVVPGQPVTINGTGFNGAKEIVFPGDIVVTDFEVVTNEMIYVTTPAGIQIDSLGEPLIIRNDNEKAVSPRLMTQGKTVVTGFSEEPGAEVKAKSIVKVFGKDMEFVNKATFINDEDEEVVLEQQDFYRIATNSLAIRIPNKVKEGLQVATFETFDGQKFELPEYNYVAAGTGHWETKKVVLWENPDPAGNGVTNWNGLYRFGLEGTEDPKNPCIATFDAETWDVIKNTDICFLYEGDGGSNVRITTGWWTSAYGNHDDHIEHNCIDMAEDDEATGMKVINLNFKEDGNLYDNLDVQNLLFTGSAYTPMALYILEKVWVEDAEGHMEHVTLWKNDGSFGATNWNGIYRFGLEGTEDPKNPCAALFDVDKWSMIKEGTVRVTFEYLSDNPNIRITTGWWTSAYGNHDDHIEHNCIDFVQEDAEGNKFIELNIKEDGNLYDNIDVQNLLFTGSDYKVSEIYVEVWVEDGSGPRPVVLWENSDPAGNGVTNWNGIYRFGLEGTEDPKNPCIATFDADTWSIIKEGTIYFVFNGDESSNVRITTGWWTSAYGNHDDHVEHNCMDMAEDDASSGMKVIKVNLKEDGNLYDNIDVQNLLFTGSGYTPMKIYYMK